MAEGMKGMGQPIVVVLELLRSAWDPNSSQCWRQRSYQLVSKHYELAKPMAGMYLQEMTEC